MGLRLLVIGDVAWDIFIRPEGDLVRGSDVLGTVDVLPGGATWQNGVNLREARALDDELSLGHILRLDLAWQASEPITQPAKVFLHLVAVDGSLAAQRDAEPVDGTRPLTSWLPGEVIADRAGLWLPADLVAGDYRLLLGLYDAGLHPGQRVPVGGGEADSIPLARIRVQGDAARILTLVEN